MTEETESDRIEAKALAYLKKYCVSDKCDDLTAAAIHKVFGRMRRLERHLAKAQPDNNDKEATNEI